LCVVNFRTKEKGVMKFAVDSAFSVKLLNDNILLAIECITTNKTVFQLVIVLLT
jgi:hypothetical protein